MLFTIREDHLVLKIQVRAKEERAERLRREKESSAEKVENSNWAQK